MYPEEIIENIKTIKKDHPENLMARHFNDGYFLSLDNVLQQRLIKIINTGIQNPNSKIGAYAMNPEDYDLFSTMLEPMIRDAHSIPPETKIIQRHDWGTKNDQCDLSAIDQSLRDVSMRVRVARNVSTFPLPGNMNKEQRIAFENIASQAFTELAKDKNFGGKYLSITPDSPNKINETEYNKRVKAHQMFKDMSADPYLNAAGISKDWPHGRGMYISENEDFIVWVGEEDHLRIMSIQHGGNLNGMFNRLHTGLEILSSLLPRFATSDTYGNITSCPTNLGAGMRASLHIKLPKMTENGQDLSDLKKVAKTLGLSVRGAGGEHSDAGKNGLVDISPSARLGVTETEIMHRLYDGASALWAIETS